MEAVPHSPECSFFDFFKGFDVEFISASENFRCVCQFKKSEKRLLIVQADFNDYEWNTKRSEINVDSDDVYSCLRDEDLPSAFSSEIVDSMSGVEVESELCGDSVKITVIRIEKDGSAFAAVRKRWDVVIEGLRRLSIKIKEETKARIIAMIDNEEQKIDLNDQKCNALAFAAESNEAIKMLADPLCVHTVRILTETITIPCGKWMSYSENRSFILIPPGVLSEELTVPHDLQPLHTKEYAMYQYVSTPWYLHWGENLKAYTDALLELHGC